jgi:DNA-binding FrmR family transcriptional regulator
MLERDEDCMKILTQMKASRAGMDRVITDYLHQNLSGCLDKDVKPAKLKEMKGLLKELAKQ